MRIGLLHSRIRMEEKMLIKAFRDRNIELIRVNDDKDFFELDKTNYELDVLLERSISFSRGIYISKIFENYGVPVVNDSDVAQLCGDKYFTTQALLKAKVPTPRVMMAFSESAALEAIEKMGYPCVMKPVTGSWARLISKVNDRNTAESIIEHKKALGNYMHSVFYIQEYINKPGRDIRAFFVGDEAICAIYRSSEHWITNTARGGKASVCPITPEINEICCNAAEAVGGGILAMDLFETDAGLTINEINHTMEFRNSVTPTGVNIPGRIAEYVIEVAKK